MLEESNAIPSALKLPEPRRVRCRIRNPFVGYSIVMNGIITLLTLFFGCALFMQFRLAQDGHDESFLVLACISYEGKGHSTKYQVRAQGQDGRLVDIDVDQPMKKGEKVTQRVLQVGSTNVCHGGSSSQNDMFLVVIELALFPLFCLAWSHRLVLAFKDRSLVRYGKPVRGKIVARRCIDFGDERGKLIYEQNLSDMYMLKYQFNFQNRKQEAEMRAISISDYERLTEGTEVTVLVGETHRRIVRESTIYEACQYEALDDC